MVATRCSQIDITAGSNDLNNMPYAFGARYTEEKGCLPGTREFVLRDICDILNDPAEDAPQMCLLTGVAGSGKSAITHSIARLYEGQRGLGRRIAFPVPTSQSGTRRIFLPLLRATSPTWIVSSSRCSARS